MTSIRPLRSGILLISNWMRVCRFFIGFLCMEFVLRLSLSLFIKVCCRIWIFICIVKIRCRVGKIVSFRLGMLISFMCLVCRLDRVIWKGWWKIFRKKLELVSWKRSLWLKSFLMRDRNSLFLKIAFYIFNLFLFLDVLCN